MITRDILIYVKIPSFLQKHVLFVTLSRQKICSLDFIGSDDGKECPSTPSNLDYSFHMIEIMHFLVRTWDIFNSFDCFQLQFETQFFKRKCDLNMTTLLQIMGFLGFFWFFWFFFLQIMQCAQIGLTLKANFTICLK